MFRLKDREKCQALFQKYYKGARFHDALYRELIRKYLKPGTRVLDAGCGRYMKFSRELSDASTVVGIDLDWPLDTRNTATPFAVRGDVYRLPFPSESFDMVISRSVLEHLENPPAVFGEFWRVLKPGGRVVMITPNKYDYVSLIAAVTPYRFHRFIVSKIFRAPEDDVFPTLYRANTLGSLDKGLARAGFLKRELRTITHYPAYLMFSPVLFRVGVLYERLCSLEALRSLRGSILCAFEKAGTSVADERRSHATVTAQRA